MMNLRQLVEEFERSKGGAVDVDDGQESTAIYCVIMDMNPIKKSKGTDYYRQLFVLDETIDGAWCSLDKIEVG